MKKAIMNTMIILFALMGCIVQAQAQQSDKQVQGNDEKVYTVVDVMPEFPGGPEALMKFIAQGIRYPKRSMEQGEQGRVICSFIVAKDGTIHTPKVVKSVSPELDKEAIRVLKTMPRWTPGKAGGKAVAVEYTVPVIYSLKRVRN
ncbi:energy transducer TonB [Parabacteroides sp.]